MDNNQSMKRPVTHTIVSGAYERLKNNNNTTSTSNSEFGCSPSENYENARSDEDYNDDILDFLPNKIRFNDNKNYVPNPQLHWQPNYLTNQNCIIIEPEIWSRNDEYIFNEIVNIHGKCYVKIRQYLPHKSISSIISHYHNWELNQNKKFVSYERDFDEKPLDITKEEIESIASGNDEDSSDSDITSLLLQMYRNKEIIEILREKVGEEFEIADTSSDKSRENSESSDFETD